MKINSWAPDSHALRLRSLAIGCLGLINLWHLKAYLGKFGSATVARTRTLSLERARGTILMNLDYLGIIAIEIEAHAVGVTAMQLFDKGCRYIGRMFVDKLATASIKDIEVDLMIGLTKQCRLIYVDHFFLPLGGKERRCSPFHL